VARRKVVKEDNIQLKVIHIPEPVPNPETTRFLNRIKIVTKKARDISAYDRCKIAVSNPADPDDLVDICLAKREVYLPSGDVFIIPQEFIV